MQAAELLERSSELDVCSSAVDAAAAGNGGLLVFLGPGGIGKTSLLRSLRTQAQARGFRVLTARGAEIERGFAFGIPRQLFESLLLKSSDDERRDLIAGPAAAGAEMLAPTQPDDGRHAGDAFASIHGLFWLTANLAERGPLLIAIDDAHWADEDSMRWLTYLAGRLEGLTVLLAVAARPSEPGIDSGLLTTLTTTPGVRVVSPGPLSQGGVRDLIERSLGDVADAGFVRACAEVTAGNPFLLGELLSSLQAAGVAPTREGIARVERLTPESIRRTVLTLIARMPAAAHPMIRALAVLGESAEVKLTAELAEVDDRIAEEAIAALVAAHVLIADRALEFRHPIVRSSVYADIGPAERARLHHQAAHLLDERRSPPRVIAAQLLHVEPAADAWAAELLWKAGWDALVRGAPEAAAALLERALREPPPPELRPRVVRDLGTADALTNRPQEAIAHLTEAFETTTDPASVLWIGGALASALFAIGRLDEAFDTYERALSGPSASSSERLELIAGIQLLGMSSHALHKRYLERFSGETDQSSDPEALAGRAFSTALTASPAAPAVDLAAKSLELGLLSRQGPNSSALVLAVMTLLAAEEFEAGAASCTAAMDLAVERGFISAFGLYSCLRSAMNHGLGRIADAEADAMAAVNAGLAQFPTHAMLISSCLGLALLERGDLVGAEAALARSSVEEWSITIVKLETRGCVRIAAGDLESGIADLLECGRREAAWEIRTPAWTRWRSHIAPALARVGRSEEARRLIDEELDRARAWDRPMTTGMALRSAGLVEGGERGIELLREAIATLEGSPARLEWARTLVDLGTVLRRSGRNKDAREPLRSGLETARACSATALAEFAHAELVASGARPRKIVHAGVEALTASEQRVASMVAGGMTNREVAQALFVTVRTVETHLQHVYQKLGITSRARLRSALEPK